MNAHRQLALGFVITAIGTSCGGGGRDQNGGGVGAGGGGGGGGGGAPAGLSVTEANTLGGSCMALVDQANSYNVPNQLPAYYGAACTENFIAKQNLASMIAAGAAKGLTVTDSQARAYVQQYADSCAANVASATSLFSSGTAVAGAPAEYNAIIDKMVAQLKLIQPVVTASTGPVYLDCKTAAEGGGGGTPGAGGTTGGGGSASAPSDDYMAGQIALTARAVSTFLWNRDINPLAKAQFSVSNNCLLAGAYSASGTRGFLTTSCTGTPKNDVSYTMTACEHGGDVTGESVIFTGSLRQQYTGVYAGSCSGATSASETLTATGMTVEFQRAGTSIVAAFQKTFQACDVELNYVKSPGVPSTLTGRVCGIAVNITYTTP
jgi:hypothetical protein